MKAIRVVSLCFLLSFGCSEPNQSIQTDVKIDSLENEICKKRDTINILTIELKKYQNSPEIICKDIDTLFAHKNISKLSSLKNELLNYHPKAPQIHLIDSFIKDIKRQDSIKIKETNDYQNLALDKLKKKYDDVSGILWLSNPYFTHYNNDNRTSLYIGKSSSGTWLRLKMSYEGDNWIFFKSAYLSYDGNTMSIPFDEYKDKKSDNGYGGRVWEWLDIRVNDELESFLYRMIKGKTLKMRLTGKYSYTRILTQQEIKGMVDILVAYQALKNN